MELQVYHLNGKPSKIISSVLGSYVMWWAYHLQIRLKKVSLSYGCHGNHALKTHPAEGQNWFFIKICLIAVSELQPPITMTK